MRALLQRVSEASVTIEGKVNGAIATGLLAFIGIENADTQEDIDWLAKKIVQLRIFNDEQEKMNLSLQDVKGDLLIISQFTLHASTKKGNRPSYIQAAKPEVAIPLYEKFVATISALLTKPVQTGIFGADMKVALLNDGPVSIWIDSKNRE
jgi:D-tyrosyl-tRNA(Tyr) deacylase